MDFAQVLIHWYMENKRDLPWRNTRDPYRIWLSEVMLQQTRVAQGTPYFYAFTGAFPTVFDLAAASEQEVLKLWQGLGYYSRARNLHQTAQYIARDLNGIFPGNYEGLLQLKGIGEYTAAAIASFAYNEAVAVVDGNVFRVLSRFFDVPTDILSSKAKKEFSALAHELMPEKNPALFNQAIMEFGALQCVPKNPNCDYCVLNSACLALQRKKVHLLPVKTKKTKIAHRFFNYLVFIDSEGHTIIQKRSAKGIWHNLYEFPLIESERILNRDEIALQLQDQNAVMNPIVGIEEFHSDIKMHKLTHQQLHLKFWRIAVDGVIPQGMDFDTLRSFPFPIVLYNFIEKDWK